jgi:hypothetical protein
MPEFVFMNFNAQLKNGYWITVWGDITFRQTQQWLVY